MKSAIAAGIGGFIAFIRLKNLGIIVDHPANLVGLGNLRMGKVLMGILGIVLLLTFTTFKFKGGIILSIATVAVLGWAFDFVQMPENIFSLPASIAPIALKLDISSALSFLIIVIIAHYFYLFYYRFI